MDRHPQSNDRYGEYTGHHCGSRHKPRTYPNEVDAGISLNDFFGDMNIDPFFHGRRGTVPYMHDMGSDYDSKHGAQHGERLPSHCVDGLSSHNHSTHRGHHRKRGTHRHTHDKESIHAENPRKYPSGKKKLGEQLCQQALQPFSKDTGTPYPCSQADINFHNRGVFERRNKGPFVSNHQSTTEMMWQNDARRPVPPAEQAVVDKLLALCVSAEDGAILGPDLAIKVFSDLDCVFFGGCLRGNVTVAWHQECDLRKLGDKPALGICRSRDLHEGQCQILMNASRLFKGSDCISDENMLCTLLHEMCHAYERVRSPRDIEKSKDGHGKLFGTRINVVHKRAMRILGVSAIGSWETDKLRQHHVFVPHCDASQLAGASGERSRGSKHIDGSRKGENRNQESRDKTAGGVRGTDGGKIGRNAKVGGASVGPRRHHKGTDCVIM